MTIDSLRRAAVTELERNRFIAAEVAHQQLVAERDTAVNRLAAAREYALRRCHGEDCDAAEHEFCDRSNCDRGQTPEGCAVRAAACTCGIDRLREALEGDAGIMTLAEAQGEVLRLRDHDASMRASSAATSEGAREAWAKVKEATARAERAEAEVVGLRARIDESEEEARAAELAHLRLSAERDRLAAELLAALAERDRLQRACDEGLPREIIRCPNCNAQHLEWFRHDAPGIDGRKRPHHTHRCYPCGHVWDSGRWSFGAERSTGVAAERDEAREEAAALRAKLDAIRAAAREHQEAEAALEAASSAVFATKFASADYDAARDAVRAAKARVALARASLSELATAETGDAVTQPATTSKGGA